MNIETDGRIKATVELEEFAVTYDTIDNNVAEIILTARQIGWPSRRHYNHPEVVVRYPTSYEDYFEMTLRMTLTEFRKLFDDIQRRAVAYRLTGDETALIGKAEDTHNAADNVA